jgi:hypothetical protein
MLAPSVGLDIFVVHTPVSFSKGIDGLSLYCEAVLGRNPLSGAHFVFRNRSSTMIRVLFFDGHRTWLRGASHPWGDRGTPRFMV